MILDPRIPRKKLQPKAAAASPMEMRISPWPDSPSIQIRSARAREKRKKSTAKIIFFLRIKDLRTFLNLFFPSRNPVRKEEMTTAGRMRDRIFAVDRNRVSMEPEKIRGVIVRARTETAEA
jgi:hypothetical protein